MTLVPIYEPGVLFGSLLLPYSKTMRRQSLHTNIITLIH